MNCDVVLTDAI